MPIVAETFNQKNADKQAPKGAFHQNLMDRLLGRTGGCDCCLCPDRHHYSETIDDSGFILCLTHNQTRFAKRDGCRPRS